MQIIYNLHLNTAISQKQIKIASKKASESLRKRMKNVCNLKFI